MPTDAIGVGSAFVRGCSEHIDRPRQCVDWDTRVLVHERHLKDAVRDSHGYANMWYHGNTSLPRYRNSALSWEHITRILSAHAMGCIALESHECRRRSHCTRHFDRWVRDAAEGVLRLTECHCAMCTLAKAVNHIKYANAFAD